MGRLLPLCFLLGVVALSAIQITSADAVEGADLDSFKAQISKLGEQIKAAEQGRLEAEKLLSDGQAKQKSFVSEIESLQASLKDENSKLPSLEKQIILLQEEAKKLKEEEALHKDLKEKFEAVTKELEATKDTLSNTLKQLADRTSSAASASSKVAEAEKQYEAAVKERDELHEKLGAMEGKAGDLSKVQKDLQKEAAKSKQLQEVADKLTGEVESLKAEVGELKSELKQANKDNAALQKQVDKAEKAVASAEKRLEKAMQEHTSTQQALIQAEAKAEEAVKKLETMLTAWLPHWLEDRYHQVLQAVEPHVKRVQPALDSAWAQSKALTVQGQARANEAYSVTKAKTLAAWKTAKPTVDKYYATSKKQLLELQTKVSKASGPYLASTQAQIQKGWLVAKKQANEALTHPQVLKLRRQVQVTVKELEDLAIKQLKKVPALKAFAKRPTVTYLVYAVLSAPLVTILVPILALSGGKKKEAAPLPTSKINQESEIAPEPTTSKGGKSKKARRISVGDESIRVP